MCQSCGCVSAGNTSAKIMIKDCTRQNVRDIESALKEMPGVHHVHIHAHDGQTTLEYDPSLTSLTHIVTSLSERGWQAVK